MATHGVTEKGISKEIRSIDQSAVSRFLSRDYQFETAKIAAVIAYVKMRETGDDPEQLELPFDTRLAMSRFLKASGDLALLNSLLDVLTASAAR